MIHLAEALSAPGEVNSGKGDLDSMSQCLKQYTVSIHSFIQQIAVDLLQSAIRVPSDSVTDKPDQVPTLMELSLWKRRKGFYKKKTNQ